MTADNDRFYQLAADLESIAREWARALGRTEQDAECWADRQAMVIDLHNEGFESYWRKHFSIIWF